MDKYYFIDMWEKIRLGKSTEYGFPERYCICMVKAGADMEEAKDLLRSAPSDYIFIHGIKGKRECVGLLCTDGIRALADADTIFFVGSMKDDITSVITLTELESIMTDSAEYIIGTVLLLSEEIAEKIEKATIVDTLARYVEEPSKGDTDEHIIS